MIMKRYTLEGLLRLSAQVKANTLRIVPPITVEMSKSGSVNDSKRDSVRYIICSGANLQSGVIEYLQKRFRNAPIFQGYGMTETNIATLRARSGWQNWQCGQAVC
jgi:4-coumarate--CoA ligase